MGRERESIEYIFIITVSRARKSTSGERCLSDAGVTTYRAHVLMFSYICYIDFLLIFAHVGARAGGQRELPSFICLLFPTYHIYYD